MTVNAGYREQLITESKKIDMLQSDKDLWEMAREVLEDGCSSATFAPGGTTAGETYVEQHEVCRGTEMYGERRERSNALGERVKRRWAVHGIITEGRAVARPTAATYRCPRRQYTRNRPGPDSAATRS